MRHVLKINQEYLDNLLDGRKKCEIRLNDRDYQLGDELRNNIKKCKKFKKFMFFSNSHTAVYKREDWSFWKTLGEGEIDL